MNAAFLQQSINKFENAQQNQQISMLSWSINVCFKIHENKIKKAAPRLIIIHGGFGFIILFAAHIKWNNL